MTKIGKVGDHTPRRILDAIEKLKSSPDIKEVNYIYYKEYGEHVLDVKPKIQGMGDFSTSGLKAEQSGGSFTHGTIRGPNVVAEDSDLHNDLLRDWNNMIVQDVGIQLDRNNNISTRIRTSVSTDELYLLAPHVEIATSQGIESRLSWDGVADILLDVVFYWNKELSDEYTTHATNI